MTAAVEIVHEHIEAQDRPDNVVPDRAGGA
jgi:hypothetical protein